MNKYLVNGIMAAALMFAFYSIALSAANSQQHAFEQFKDFWYLLIPLFVLVGAQVGLYTYIHDTLSEARLASSKNGVAASVGISTGSMVACCVHHLADIMPLLGLTAAAAFFSQYQSSFMLLGVVSGIIGTIYMLDIIKKNSIACDWLRSLVQYDMAKAWNAAIVAGVVLAALGFVFPPGPLMQPVFAGGNAQFSAQTLQQNGLTISAQPALARGQGSVSLAMNTHQGSLELDFARVSYLEADGVRYNAVSWAPSGSSHHLTGTLSFGSVPQNARSLKLVISGVYNADWVFQWPQ